MVTSQDKLVYELYDNLLDVKSVEPRNQFIVLDINVLSEGMINVGRQSS